MSTHTHSSNRLYSNIGAEEAIKENPYVHGDESIYDCVCYYQRPVVGPPPQPSCDSTHLPHPSITIKGYIAQKLPPDCDEKRTHILEELHTTEQNFLQALNVIVEVLLESHFRSLTIHLISSLLSAEELLQSAAKSYHQR